MPYTWIEISKSALLHNLGHYKKFIGTHNLLAPVIKANAYGHGMQQIAQICQESPDVDWICVALLSDAIVFRTQNITKPIFVLGHIDVDPALAINKNIDLLVYDLHAAEQLNAVGMQHNYIFNIHIKIDTGLSRLGVLPHEAIPTIKKIKEMPYLAVQGIYSHLAESQMEDDTFTQQQLKQFNTLLVQLEKENIIIPFKHVANTAASTRFFSKHYNFFRIGAGMYGLWPSEVVKNITLTQSPNFTLRPAFTWKTRIMHIKKLKSKSYIGYNRTHQLTQDSTIAVLPIGYYDGYDIRYSNKGMVKIHDVYAPIIGRVCMNHTIININDIPNAHIGTEVTLMSNDPMISPHRFAQLTGNNNVREVLTNIYPHIKRIIVP
jgi:alanine racemase